MSKQICQLCGEAPSQNWELIENWAEVKKMLKVIFKIDLPDQSVNNCFCTCSLCNEKLICVYEFYHMVLEAEDRLKNLEVKPSVTLRRSPILVSDSDSDTVEEETSPQEPQQTLKLGKDRVDTHRKPMYECEKCGGRFQRLEALRVHMSSHLSKEGTKLNKEEKRKRRRVSSVVSYADSVVGDNIPRQSHQKNLKVRSKTCHRAVSIPSVQCKICNRFFINEFGLKHHMDYVHSDNGPHICDVCQKETSSSRALKTHKQYVHDSDRKYSCSYCEKVFKKEKLLKEHVARHLKNFKEKPPMIRRNYPTMVPDREFGSVEGDTAPQRLERFQQNLKLGKDRVDNHLKLMYECEKCGRRFQRLEALRVHMSSHLSKEGTTLDKEEKRKRRRVSSVVSYADSVVGDNVPRQSHQKNLKVKSKTCHRAVSIPSVQCKICNRFFINEFGLKHHMDYVHSDNGPHICDVCQKETSSTLALKSHKRYMHDSDRKYSCSYCEKVFKKDKLLKEHEARHLGEPLYACQFCSKTFNRSSYMYTHRKWMHPQEYRMLKESNHLFIKSFHTL